MYDIIEIIPNIRFNDERTYLFCFDGIEKNKTVAIGTHGCIKRKEDKKYFQKGLNELVKRLTPQTIIVYGTTTDNIFKPYKDMGIKYPGNNPRKLPGKGFEWRGKSSPQKGKGNWYNPKTGEKWNSDLDNGGPIGPHWDYTDANGNSFRVYPDGHVESK